MQYVYLIKCNDNHFDTKYKIGIAQDVRIRLAQLQTGSPYVLEVMECYGYENAEVVERALHQAFKSQRIQGEWFVLNYVQATEDFSKICTMLGGVVGIVEDKSTPADVDKAEDVLALSDGNTWLELVKVRKWFFVRLMKWDEVNKKKVYVKHIGSLEKCKADPNYASEAYRLEKKLDA